MIGEDRKDAMNDSQDRLLMRRIHGELAGDEARALERRIAADPRLAARHRRLADAWDDLQVPDAARAPDGFVAATVAAARRRGAGLPAGELRWSLAPVWARAGALAALILGLALGTSLGSGAGGDLSEPELGGDQEAYLLLAEPSSLAESFWLTLEESEGSLANGSDGGERVQ
jgi:anti-sigma factor RsiW